MTLRAPRSVAWALALSVLLMLGATTGSAFAHEIEHASHHAAGMHSSGICAWMCAAAGSMVTAALQPLRHEPVRDELLLPVHSILSADPPLLLLPRAPPTSV